MNIYANLSPHSFYSSVFIFLFSNGKKDNGLLCVCVYSFCTVNRREFYSLRTVVDIYIYILILSSWKNSVCSNKPFFCSIYFTIGANSHIHCFYFFLAVECCTVFFSFFVVVVISFSTFPMCVCFFSCGICQSTSFFTCY